MCLYQDEVITFQLHMLLIALWTSLTTPRPVSANSNDVKPVPTHEDGQDEPADSVAVAAWGLLVKFIFT